MKVLIIDDENDIRRIARLGLSKIGKMTVIDVNNGASGIEKAILEQPEAILLDVMMPDMDGPATLAVLQANPATKDIPVVFLTAKTLPAELARLNVLGVKGILTKPFDPITLAAQLRAIITAK